MIFWMTRFTQRGCKMDITIHRGTRQIGGCVTEIATANARIIIDFGAELPRNEEPSNPLAIEGLTYGNASYDAVFFTHYHGDHIGMLKNILDEIPIYLGEAAKDIFLTLQKYLKNDIARAEKAIAFSAAKPIQIKDIMVTPFTVDHSAFDSYMLLIEAEGKKILHTGDFRAHGFKGKGLIPILKKYVGIVDLLIIEGTMLSRSGEKVLSEGELRLAAKDYMNRYKYVYMLCSSTNIDRIAAFYHATPRGKYFICDRYQKEILQVVTRHGSKYSNLYSFSKALTYADNLNQRMADRGFCMLIRANGNFEKLMNLFDKSQSIILYSQWKGYLHDVKYHYTEFLKGYHWEYLHTSGHADHKTLHEVIKVISPKTGVLPIHSESPEMFKEMELPCRVILANDGETMSI